MSHYTDYTTPVAVIQIPLHIHAATAFRLHMHSQFSSTITKLTSITTRPTLRRYTDV
jgi:hypothetical protein